jgi:hypothetical protein
LSGYLVGETAPTAECGCCGGEAVAQWCGVGVGMVQIEPFRCMDCGAQLDPLVDGERATGWVSAAEPAEARITGYYVNDRGGVISMTFDKGHAEYNEMVGATTGGLLHRGWVRITNLEGYAIDLPPFMTSRTRRALSDLLGRIEDEKGWGVPYMKAMDEDRGREVHWTGVMAVVSRLPVEQHSEEGLPGLWR